MGCCNQEQVLLQSISFKIVPFTLVLDVKLEIKGDLEDDKIQWMCELVAEKI